MREVAVVGIGQTPVSEQWNKSLKEIAGDAIFAAQKDCGIQKPDGIYIGNMLSDSANKQQNLATLIADWIGAKNVEGVRLESACSSGATAFRAAFLAVASGEKDIAFAVGVEKMTDLPSSEITSRLATAASAEWELDQGVSFVALNALIMRRYMYEYGWQHKDFANFSINAHKNAVNNPNAMFRSPISEERYLKSPMICDPINLMDASPIGDGAAVAILVPADKVKGNKIRIAGSAAVTDTIAIHDRNDPLWLTAAEKSSKKAYNQANVTPEDIDFFEYHDAFTIMAALSMECNGFIERGQGPRMAIEGNISLDSKLPVATMGGLKARGHPVGATGMYQLIEVVHQLRGTVGENQVAGAHIGMAQNIGGSGSNIVTHILRND